MRCSTKKLQKVKCIYKHFLCTLKLPKTKIMEQNWKEGYKTNQDKFRSQTNIMKCIPSTELTVEFVWGRRLQGSLVGSNII